MRITYIQNGNGSTVYWSIPIDNEEAGKLIYTQLYQKQQSSIPFINKNCIREPTHVEIDIAYPHWQMCFCHEIAHVLLGYPEKYATDCAVRYQNEHDAWRLAKSFCKSEYWDEKEALFCLETYRISSITKITKIIATNKFKQ